jgi:hypothetical protein
VRACVPLISDSVISHRRPAKIELIFCQHFWWDFVSMKCYANEPPCAATHFVGTVTHHGKGGACEGGTTFICMN